MKKFKFLLLAVVAFLSLNISAKAMSINYELEEFKLKSVFVGNSVQLNVYEVATNDLWVVGEKNPDPIKTLANDKCTWTSSDSSVVSVSSTGLIKALKKGSANIYVKTPQDETLTYSITVVDETYLMFEVFMGGIPQHYYITDQEQLITLNAQGIEYKDLDKISLKIDNEKIAKVDGKSYRYFDEQKAAIITIKVKYLSVGETNLTASINYNGKTYSDTQFIKIEERIQVKENTETKQETKTETKQETKTETKIEEPTNPETETNNEQITENEQKTIGEDTEKTTPEIKTEVKNSNNGFTTAEIIMIVVAGLFIIALGSVVIYNKVKPRN